MRILCKNLYDHMLCILTPINFTRIQQLIKIKQEDHILSMLTIGLIFFLARACQHKISKLESQFYHLPSSSYAIYKIETILKALILLNLILPEKYPKQQISYFYQIVLFKMNLIKFGLPHLDTPSSRYNFCILATKSVKNK